MQVARMKVAPDTVAMEDAVKVAIKSAGSDAGAKNIDSSAKVAIEAA